MSQNNASIQFPSGSGGPVMQEDVLMSEAMKSHPQWRLINELLLRKNKSVADLQQRSEQMIEWVLQAAINDVLPAMTIYQVLYLGQDTPSSSRSTSCWSIISSSPSSPQSSDQEFSRSIEEEISATTRDTDSKEAIIVKLWQDAEEKTRALADILTDDVHEQIPQRPMLDDNTNTSKAVFYWHKWEVKMRDTDDKLFFQVYKLLLEGRLPLTRRCHSETDGQSLQAKQHLDWELFGPLVSSFISVALEKLLLHYLGLASSIPDLHLLVNSLVNWPCRKDRAGSSSPVPGPSPSVGRKQQTSSATQDQRRALEAMTEVLATEGRGVLRFICNDPEKLIVIVDKGLQSAIRTQVDDISNSSSDVCQAKQDVHEEETSDSIKSLDIPIETQVLSWSPLKLLEAWTSSEPSDLWPSAALEKAEEEITLVTVLNSSESLQSAIRTQVDDISNSSSDVCQAKQVLMSDSIKSREVPIETQVLSWSPPKPLEAWTSSEPSDLWPSAALETAVSVSLGNLWVDDGSEMGSSQEDMKRHLKKTKPSGLRTWFELMRKNNKVGLMVTENTSGSVKTLMTKAEEESTLVTIFSSSESPALAESASVPERLKKKRSIKGLFQRMSAALSEGVLLQLHE